MKAMVAPPQPDSAVRDAVLLHLLFTALAVIGVLAPVGPLGWRLIALVVLYAGLMLAAAMTRRPEFKSVLRFLMPLSVFQVVPDWFLSQQLQILVFPDTGGPRIGTVPACMAGLWTIPLFIALFTAEAGARRHIP